MSTPFETKQGKKLRKESDGVVSGPLVVQVVAPEGRSGTQAFGAQPPLSHEEAQLAERAMRRLHEQLRAFLAGLPSDGRTASGMARVLSVDRTTCQRLVFTASRPYPGLTMLERLPGGRGIRQVVEAARSVGLDGEAIAALETAVGRFEEVLQTLGGSRSALLRRIGATPAAAGPRRDGSLDQAVTARQRMFEAAAELTGRCSDTWVAVYVYHPLQVGSGSPATIEVARAHGLIGHAARPDAVPLTFHNFTSKQDARSKGDDDTAPVQGFRPLHDGDPDGRTPAAVLTEFSTNPLPVVSSRQPGEYLVQAIDTDPSTGARPIDLMLGTRNTMIHPALQPPCIEEVWAMINFPVRRMVFDVYLHRDLARTCIPSLDVHLWRPDFTANVGDRWQTRFADGPRLEVLGQGIANASTPWYARHAELTSFLVQRLMLDSDRFIGYRCALEYPAWRTGYCMSFDFNTGDDEP
jgi:hypothetical protein